MHGVSESREAVVSSAVWKALEAGSDLSSSSSSYSSSEDESVGEEEDEDSEEETGPGPRTAERGDRERRKRKRKVAGRRRELRSKYESVKDFNPEARSAQTEEIERIRRLELQRSLQAATPTGPVVTGENAEPTALGRGPVFRNLAEDEQQEKVDVEAIVISSDSDEDDEEQERWRRSEGGGVGEGVREVKREEGRGGRYDSIGEEKNGQMVINTGHLPEEEDVTLAPQIARIIKPHQV